MAPPGVLRDPRRFLFGLIYVRRWSRDRLIWRGLPPRAPSSDLLLHHKAHPASRSRSPQPSVTLCVCVCVCVCVYVCVYVCVCVCFSPTF